MLKRILLTNIRNYSQAEFFPESHSSLIYGDNGAGKTSLLEAIYSLSTGKSFRTGRLRKLVKDSAESGYVYAEVSFSGHIHRIGIQRNRQGIEDIRIDGLRPSGLSDIAKLIPCRAFHSDSLRLILGESSFRRRFVDWGLFHVEQQFLACWKRLQTVLKQRNCLLKTELIFDEQIDSWDKQLIDVSVRIDQFRKNYLQELRAYFKKALEGFGSIEDVSLSYASGWPANDSFSDALYSARQMDLHRGFTSIGPQRADVRVKQGSHLVKDVCSRGQIKTIAYALLVAQISHLIDMTGKECLLLVDDLESELDAVHQKKLVGQLLDTDQQIIFTSLDNRGLKLKEDTRVFHVEHGQIKDQGNGQILKNS